MSYLNNLKLINFRNFKELTINFSPMINFIIGNNGSGKSNIIEALSLISNLRSFRNADDREIIKWNEDGYFISVEDGNKNVYELGCFNKDKSIKKKVKVNGSIINKISQYYGGLLTTSYSPDDLYFVNGYPETRRRYFDSVISKYNSEYFIKISEFKKAIVSRNRLLKNIKENGENKIIIDELDVFDKIISDKADYIINERLLFVENFSLFFSESYNYISSNEISPLLEYVPDIRGNKESIQKDLLNNRKRDIFLGSTGKGPHKDEYVLCNEKSIRFQSYASQGQKRTAVISLKDAEKKYLEKKTGSFCILLVDDVFSELDKKRRENLIETMSCNNQVFFTAVTIDKDISERFPVKKIYTVDNGKVNIHNEI